MFKIEKGVPIPKTKRGGAFYKEGTVPPKYPFGKMKVGDSFEYDTEIAGKVKAAASDYGKNHNMKFTTRKINGKTRIWRIK